MSGPPSPAPNAPARLKTRLSGALTVACSLAAAATIGWVASRHAESPDTFQQRRIALLESEVARLRQALEGHAQAQALPALREKRKEIEQRVEKIRGLAFKTPVQYDMVTRAGIREVLHQKLSEQLSVEEFRHVALALSAFGFLEPGYPLREKYVDLLSEQVAAFFDQHTHKLFMFQDADLGDIQNQVILAHELTHALQDQHFSLLSLPLEIKTNDDRAFAASALVEGEATVVMTEFMLQSLSWQTMRESLTGLLTQNMAQLQSAPPYLQAMLLFPYLRGQEFVMHLQAQGGYSAVTAAYDKPPSSTAQILHPELFLGENRVEPIEVAWENPAFEGTPPVYLNVLGEMGIRLLLSEVAKLPQANEAAAGWAGDRYLLFEKGDEWQFFWRTLWRSPEEAEEFATALEAWAKNRRVAQPGRSIEIYRPDPLTVEVANATVPKAAGTLRKTLGL